MQLQSASFKFKNGIVTWTLLNKADAKICESSDAQFNGRPYKWRIIALIDGYQTDRQSFVSPSSASAKRFLQNIKSQIPKIS